MNRGSWVLLALGLLGTAALVAVFAAGFGKDPHAVPSVLESKLAPDFSLKTLDGNQTIALSDLRGRPVVVNFWSSWCQPCKIEHPLLQQAATAWTNTAFLGIVYSDDPEKARLYLQKVGSTYPSLADERNRTAIDYGVAGVPETFFIDAQGVITYKHVGPLDRDTLMAMLGPLGNAP